MMIKLAISDLARSKVRMPLGRQAELAPTDEVEAAIETREPGP